MANRNHQNRTDAFIKPHRTLLTEEQEIKLFQEWREAPEGSLKKTRLLDQIVLNFTPIIRKSMKELSGYNIDPEELSSEGLLALVEAAYRYDLGRGLRFSTYARSWVKGVMLGFITKNYFPVNVCTSHDKKKLFFSMRRFISTELKKNGCFDMTAEIMQKLSAEYGIPEDEIAVLNNMFRKPYESLSETISPYGTDGDTTRGDMLESPDLGPEELYVQETMDAHHSQIVQAALDKTLDEREKAIFIAQSLQEKDEVATLESLGEKFRISKERVRQIRDQARIKVEREIRRRVTREELFG